jgi:hypothetical protein
MIVMPMGDKDTVNPPDGFPVELELEVGTSIDKRCLLPNQGSDCASTAVLWMAPRCLTYIAGTKENRQLETSTGAKEHQFRQKLVSVFAILDHGKNLQKRSYPAYKYSCGSRPPHDPELNQAIYILAVSGV